MNATQVTLAFSLALALAFAPGLALTLTSFYECHQLALALALRLVSASFYEWHPPKQTHSLASRQAVQIPRPKAVVTAILWKPGNRG